MLVLTRKLEESIVIGQDVIITILAIDKDKVKIGISAPREIPVLRKELFQAIQEQSAVVEQLAASQTTEHFDSLRDLLLQQSPPEEEKPDAEQA
ncbi:MAG: carbon storage regulator CsrA [Leptolinea sp.]